MVMTAAEIRSLQRRLNAFFKKTRLKYPKLEVDGRMGRRTKIRVEQAKYYLGYKGDLTDAVNAQFLWRLNHPHRTSRKLKVGARDVKRGMQRRGWRRKALRSPQWSWAWGGCRGVTNEVIRIVGGRANVTSRKRRATYGNPGSDHHVSQVRADAVDFDVAEAHWLKNEISRRMGGPAILPDYGSFYITRKGKRFRVQMIAGTHGTGPHLHVGVRRA